MITNTGIETLKFNITDAADLDALCAALNSAEESYSSECESDPELYGTNFEQWIGIDLADLPTFGGDGPADTMGIYSWDDGHVLVADGSLWSIEPREDDDTN